ncbi:DUF2934 domain-containing protein [Pseudomonas stutzeri]|uniref:DUF2934 domain-containing protein n=1 Tax=Stutzerimonas stutzeri TaxID=316 RepID=UPI00210DB35B|nr:DUF2934 domain-containing protein [Stutzerimonas stutzeri]MCQ4308172.1 DUF2934 domain-containing protein [Stutzerimonas stutzeri]
MNKNEQRIRELAYDIWVSEGRPHGEDERHWEMARKLAEAEAKPGDKPASRARKTATKPTDATPAAKTAKATKTAKDANDPKDVKPAKADAAAKGTASPKAKAGTDAAEGTPAGVKKTRAPRTKKEA